MTQTQYLEATPQTAHGAAALLSSKAAEEIVAFLTAKLEEGAGLPTAKRALRSWRSQHGEDRGAILVAASRCGRWDGMVEVLWV